jgi:hypothetical protein
VGGSLALVKRSVGSYSGSTSIFLALNEQVQLMWVFDQSCGLLVIRFLQSIFKSDVSIWPLDMCIRGE